MGNIVKFAKASDVDSRPSPAVWGSCPLSEIILNGHGIHVFEDFIGFSEAIAESSNVTHYGSSTGIWKAYEDDNTNIIQADAFGGILHYDGHTTDNVEANLQLGVDGGAFVCSRTAGAKYPLWFECRIRKELITDTQGFLIGLASPDATGNSLIADAGTDISDIDFLGFFATDADGDTVDAVYQITGGALTQSKDAVHTLVAATWVKLGFVYNPLAPDSKKIAWYVDGTEQGTYVTDTNMAAATFPNGEELSPIIGFKQGTNVDQYTEVDWVKVAQLREEW